MNDGPGPSAWDLAHARLAAQDALDSERLRRLCRLDDHGRDKQAHMRAAAQAREARRRAKRAATLDGTPYWPKWARRLDLAGDGQCAACGEETRSDSTSGVCGKCQQRAGREAVRMRLAVRLYRAGEWTS